MLIPEVALRFRSDGAGESVVVAVTAAPSLVRTVASKLVREAEVAVADAATNDDVLALLLHAEVQRLRAVCTAIETCAFGRALPRA